MKKFFAVAALILGILCVQTTLLAAAVTGHVFRCSWCKQEIKTPPYTHPADIGYKHGCPAAPFGDMHEWKAVGFHFSDGSVSYTK